jgi:TonB family protein
MKILVAFGLCLVILLPGCASKPVTLYTLHDPQIQKETCLPIVHVFPAYPKVALHNRIAGYVIIEFVLNHKGLPKDPRIIESSPPDIFDKAALSAARKNKYMPCLVNGKPVDTTGAREKIIFDPEQGVHYLGGNYSFNSP